MDFMNRINETTEYIQNIIRIQPEIGIILGSGLGALADEMIDATRIDYNEIPNFPVSTVKGHKGRLVIGKLEDKNVVAMQGRFHYYEGYKLEDVTFPVRVMKALGIKCLLVTNAAGGVNKQFIAGDLMIIDDHINFAFDNPLIGRNYEELGLRFPDMSNAYDKKLIKIASEAGERLGVKLQKGTYMWMAGPNYETPAEVRMASFVGADAVGMSTVPEVISAVHGGLRVLGISCITNMAAGILAQPLDHSEVIETSDRVKNTFIRLVKEIINSI
ncbi:purine-nucleoside phosphorylase [Brassicibacter mesophilus]|uniref:purine-nucleoside phosphorylase n=1 Tax=Brassicibacter mesophilus TaxID=745119 RepID=UPI003D1D6D5C